VSTALRVLIALVVAGTAASVAGATFAFPLREGFGVGGLAFWIAATAVASAAPVRLPRGTMAAVSGAPILAAAFLGGPAAAGWVAAIGTTEWRELKGSVPWYGSLYNHAAVVIPAILSGLAYEWLDGRSGFVAEPQTLGAAVVAGVIYLATNSALSAAAIALREGHGVRSVVAGDSAIVAASMLAYAPLAWLMAHAATTIGGWAVFLFAIPLYTTRGAYQRVVELREMFTQTVRSLASAVDAKDKFTSGHSERVQRIAADIGREMRCSEKELEALEWGGLLHDIGKIGVPDAVLLKQDKLNKEERIIMNAHPVKGEEIIKPVQRLAPELPIIRHHHEWYNGSGYPDHLEGDQIPKLARILSVADAFEAMTAARPYRMTPLTAEEAMGELRKYAGIQFDPDMVDAFERTDWVAHLPDRERPPAKVIPVLAKVAAMRAEAARRADAG
jgi:HD-GYP domain-containing protein (c-di-GMP phosphodiesterase class II)